MSQWGFCLSAADAMFTSLYMEVIVQMYLRSSTGIYIYACSHAVTTHCAKVIFGETYIYHAPDAACCFNAMLEVSNKFTHK